MITSSGVPGRGFLSRRFRSLPKDEPVEEPLEAPEDALDNDDEDGVE